MALILPPVASTTFILALVVPLAIGFLVGIVIKSALKIGAALAIIALLLIFIGILTPSQVIQPILSAVRSGPALTSKVQQVAGYLPYSSITFLIGLAIGFFR
jgi:hypothetical protein